jgi:hypothetical protein
LSEASVEEDSNVLIPEMKEKINCGVFLLKLLQKMAMIFPWLKEAESGRENNRVFYF